MRYAIEKNIAGRFDFGQAILSHRPWQKPGPHTCKESPAKACPMPYSGYPHPLLPSADNKISVSPMASSAPLEQIDKLFNTLLSAHLAYVAPMLAAATKRSIKID